MSDGRERLRELVQPVLEAAARYRQAGVFQSAKPDSTDLERAAMLAVAQARRDALAMVPCLRRYTDPLTDDPRVPGDYVIFRDHCYQPPALIGLCRQCSLLRAAEALIAELEGE